MTTGVRVRGYVLGYPHSQPIVGAEIAVTSPRKSTFTNREGLFCLYVPTGEHTLMVTADGWEYREMDLAVVTPLQIDFLLRRVK